MSPLPKNIADLIAAPKELPFRPKWNAQNDSRNFTLSMPLSVGEATLGGFELRGRISKLVVDRGAMLQLMWSTSPRSGVPLWRCQWRPFETHTNPFWGPPGLEGLEFISESHHHSFEDNFLSDERQMRAGNLPAARRISPDPSTLSEFLAFCGECFKINNIEHLDIPQVSPDFFWMNDG